MKHIVFFLFLISSLVFWASCKHDPLQPFDPNDPFNPTDTIPLPPSLISDCDPDSTYFLNQILPLLEISCGSSESTGSCHNGANSESGISFNSYEDLFMNIEDDPNESPEYLFTPGNYNGSEIYEVIHETDASKQMPPPSSIYSISNEAEQMLGDWIDQGAQYNGCTEGCDTTNVSFQNDIFPIINFYCSSCHSGTNPSGDLLLTNYEGISSVIESIIDRINRDENDSESMPNDASKLIDCYIQQIEIWAADGSPEN